jgi:hypothetical protein
MKKRSYVLLSALFAMCVCAQTGVQQSGKCTIEGVVTGASTGAPLSKVDIVLSPEGTRKALLVTHTDSSGRFVINELDPGRYTLRAERSGYVSQDYGERGKSSRGTVLVLHPGQISPDINFRLIATGVLTGRILGEDNDPVIGSIVRAFVIDHTEGQRRLIVRSQSITDDRGVYRIFGLHPGRYYLCAAAPEPHRTIKRPKGAPAEQRYIPTFFPNVNDSTQATALDVQAGSELTGVDITLPRTAGFHIRGSVLGVDRTSHYLRLTLRLLDPGYDALDRSQDVAPDAKGVFDFDGIVQGSYVLFAKFAREGRDYSAWRRVEVSNADVNGISLTPNPGLRLPGRVRITGGSQFDFSKLTLHLRPSLFSPTERLSARINSDGTFLIHGADHDVYEVGISGLTDDSYLQSVRLGDEESADKNIDLSLADASSGSLDIVVNPAGGRIDGVVRDENNEVARGFAVALVPELNHRGDAHLFHEAITDQNGQFSIRGIAPGEYKLFAWDFAEPGADRDSAFLKPYEERGSVVELQASERKNVELRAIAAID